MADQKKIKTVLIAIPSHDGKINLQTALNLIGGVMAPQQQSIKYEFHAIMGCPYITKARNDCARKFLESGFDEMVFIDADISFPAWALNDIINQDVELVSGIYPKKVDPLEWPTMLKLNEDTSCTFSDKDENGDPAGLIEATGLPTGFMKIRRVVFEKIMEKFPDLHYIDPMTQSKTWDFFGEQMGENGMKQWDDYAFCARWAATGGRMWVAANIDFGHIGMKVYKGNFWKHIMSMQATWSETHNALGEVAAAIGGNGNGAH